MLFISFSKCLETEINTVARDGNFHFKIASLGTDFSACNCLLDSRNCLLVLWYWVPTINWIGQKGRLQFIGSLGHYFTPGLRPIFLKVSLTSACALKNLEHCLRNELWARRQSSIVSDWRPLEIFESFTKKCKKCFFFAFRQITWYFDIETHIQGTTMWKLTSSPDDSENVVVFGPQRTGTELLTLPC